jgi:hypothetical protein
MIQDIRIRRAASSVREDSQCQIVGQEWLYSIGDNGSDQELGLELNRFIGFTRLNRPCRPCESERGQIIRSMSHEGIAHQRLDLAPGYRDAT